MDITNLFKDRFESGSHLLSMGECDVPVRFVRNPRARRYILRLLPGGVARVTIPRGGTTGEAARFAARNAEWIKRQLQRQSERVRAPITWTAGKEIYFRGVSVGLETRGGEVPGTSWVRFGDQCLTVEDANGNLRPAIERHLQAIACREIPARVMELARLHGFAVRRITIRNQRSRWGSCSIRGTISLNWRLVQMPEMVRDYIILHELAHMREMNHSPRFWKEVERICPDYRDAEDWLKMHCKRLR